MADFTDAFYYKAPDLTRTRRDASVESIAIESLPHSLQDIWSWSSGGGGGGLDGSGYFMADSSSTRGSTHEGISMPFPAPASSLFFCGGGSGDIWVNDYLNGYGPNSQHTTMRMNSGSGASSAVNWACQETLLGHNLARILSQEPGRSSHMLNLGLYNNGMASRRAFDLDLISHRQPSLSSAFLDRKSNFEALKHSDILLLGKDNSGSMFLQRALSWKNLRVTNKIFEAVMGHVFDLITNQYGHHLFIKLIESCNEDQLQQILMKIASQCDLFCNASINKHGSQSIKKLITMLAGSPLVSFVVLALCSRFKEIMINRTGASVIMQCLETLDDKQNELLYEAVINNFRAIAANSNGCISLNEFISDVRGPFRQQLLNLVYDHVSFLSKDPSGNYVVQHVIQLHDPDLNEKICSELKGKYVELSMLKCGSHVVEKCLKSPGMACYVVADFLMSSNQQLLKVARHKYGNYVIQTSLKVTKNEHSSLHQDLLLKLRGLNGLQFGYGKNVYNLIVNGVPRRS
ncbi:hypothetical protein ACOSP7_015854 [Xanthoceras sorbifolium]